MQRRDWKNPFSWFDWYFYTKPKALFKYQPQGATFTGAMTFARADASTCARYRDSNGIWQVVAANVKRDQHFPSSGVGPTILLEPARTNSALGSNLFADDTYWANSATFTLATATSCVAGQTAYKHTDTSSGNGRTQVVGTFVNAQTDCLSVVMENISNTTSRLGIYDATAPGFVHLASLTWSTKATATVSGTGTSGVVDLGTGPNGGSLVLFWITATGTAAGAGTAGNSRKLYVYPSGAASTNAGILHHAQFEAAASFPSSPIVTVGSAVTRSADALSFPYAPVPQAMTVSMKYIDLQVAPNGYLCNISNAANATPQLLCFRSASSKVYVAHYNGVSTVTTQISAAPALGDLVEFCATLSATGSVQIEQSLNGAASTLSTASASLTPLAAAWAAPTRLYLNSDPTPSATYTGAMALQSIKIAAGVQSLNTMRAL